VSQWNERRNETVEPARALRRRHCVGGGAPVNFGRRRRGAGGQTFSKIPEKIVLSSKFSDDLFSHRKMQQK